MTSSERMAYFGGLLDGEGCITVARLAANSQPTVTVAVSMCDVEPLQMLRAEFGGSLIQIQRTEPNTKPIWMFRVQAKKAETLIRAVRPYLLVKRRQADLCLELRDSMKAGMVLRRGPYPDSNPERTKAIMDFREDIISKIRVLNKRGLVHAT